MRKYVSLPSEKRCAGVSGQVKPHLEPFTKFYVVPSYPDSLSRLCKTCSSIDGQIRQHQRQLKRFGRDAFVKRIQQHRDLANAMQKILDET